MNVPFARPDMTEAEQAAARSVLESGWLTSGPKVAEFEAEFAKACGEGCHAVAVSSCTMGLTLAIRALVQRTCCGIICPTWTFTATAEAIEAAGHKPVFMDIDPDDLCLSAEAVRPVHDAMVPVHIAGLTRRYATYAGHHVPAPPVIEDAAHCLPYDPGNNTAVFSFYATKPIACGEGGMVVTRSQHVAEKIRAMRWHGFDVEVHDRHKTGYRAHHVTGRGFKANMTDLAAAIGLEQLRRMDEMLDKRVRLAVRYRKHLRGCMLPPFQAGESHHLFIVRVPNRDHFISEMQKRGVACGVHYLPLHRHPYWQEKYDLRPERFPNAEAASRTAVSLPLFSGMTEDQQDLVIEAVRELLC